MKRRDVLRWLTGSGAALSFDACVHTSVDRGALTDGDIERAAISMAGMALKPGQAAGVREILGTMRFKGNVDPTVQPPLGFDPEVDVE